MTYQLNSEHYSNVIAADDASRYEYFVKRVCDWQELWILRLAETWVTKNLVSGPKCVPVWPHPLFAEMCMQDFYGSQLARIEVHDWLESYVPRLLADDLLVMVFPISGKPGVTVTPERLQTDLREELAKIED